MSLIVKKLSVFSGKKQILKDVNLEIKEGTISALMGPNGSGKTTLALTLAGSKNLGLRIEIPASPAGKYELRMDGRNIKNLKPDERARLGLFLAFQNPVAIPGVSVANLLRAAYQAIHKHNPALNVWDFNKMLVEKAKLLHIPQEFLGRSVNADFSGGEKKKIEILQALVLKPKYIILDEIDTGLDVDALKIVADSIKQLKNSGCGILIITHYLRILKHLTPDLVHILADGKIVAFGGYELAKEVEKRGYGRWTKQY